MGSAKDGNRRVCLGVIVGAHGVRGSLRVKPFTEKPEAVAAYGPVEDESGHRRFTLRVHGRHKGAVIVAIEGVDDRDQALALKGTRLYVDRAALPELDDEEAFYHADLIGLSVVTREGEALGTVAAVQNFGAGDLLEIADDEGRTLVLPFTKEAVPLVDLDAGRLVAEPPPESEET